MGVYSLTSKFMKKYRLLKDLPLAKAGTEVEVIKALHSNYSKILLDWDRIADILSEDITEWLEEIHDKPKSVWGLRRWDECYHLESDGHIRRIYWDDAFIPESKQGNIFLTREDAEKERDRRNANSKIKKWCWENGVEMAYDIHKRNYSFWLMNNESDIGIDQYFNNWSTIWFFSKENAQKILKQFPEELKLILS